MNNIVLNYSDISNDIYYNDNFSYLDNTNNTNTNNTTNNTNTNNTTNNTNTNNTTNTNNNSNSNNNTNTNNTTNNTNNTNNNSNSNNNTNNTKSNLGEQVICNIDNLYNEAMRSDANSYTRLKREDNKELEENINKMFLYNKNYYNQLTDTYKKDITISMPKKNIDILNSVYRTPYDIGILDNVEFGENVDCNEEQLKAIRNCSSNCSRNECNYENLNVILGGCRINGIPQSYGETFCMDDANSCLSIQKQYIESCSRDCYSCDADTSDITLDGCLINNIPQVYGDTFCSDNNINICSKEQIDYYERCKRNCDSCNRIIADTFMNNCTIDGEKPIHSYNYCINCNLYNRGDDNADQSCVSIKSLDGSTSCKYTPAGTTKVPAKCKSGIDPNIEAPDSFTGEENTCPEDENYYYIPTTNESREPRIESCDEILNCDQFNENKYDCISTQSNKDRCIYILPEGEARINEGNDFSPVAPQYGELSLEDVNEGPIVYKIRSDDNDGQEGNDGIGLIDVYLEENNIVYLYYNTEESGHRVIPWIDYIRRLNANNRISNIVYKNIIDLTGEADLDLLHKLKSQHKKYTCQEIYNHSLGEIPKDLCIISEPICSDKNKYIYGIPEGSEDDELKSNSCISKPKPKPNPE